MGVVCEAAFQRFAVWAIGAACGRRAIFGCSAPVDLRLRTQAVGQWRALGDVLHAASPGRSGHYRHTGRCDSDMTANGPTGIVLLQLARQGYRQACCRFILTAPKPSGRANGRLLPYQFCSCTGVEAPAWGAAVIATKLHQPA